MPSDWSYFIDQTQWDRTNHWPLLGPKTAQEWQWLKGGLLSSGPRLRYRVVSGKFEILPVPSPSTRHRRQQHHGRLRALDAGDGVHRRHLAEGRGADEHLLHSVQSDTDILLLDPWIVTAYLKLKYWEAKGLNTAAYTKDFVGTWEARIGKNKGAPMLTLAPRARTMLIGINNIPDGAGTWVTGTLHEVRSTPQVSRSLRAPRRSRGSTRTTRIVSCRRVSR